MQNVVDSPFCLILYHSPGRKAGVRHQKRTQWPFSRLEQTGSSMEVGARGGSRPEASKIPAFQSVEPFKRRAANERKDSERRREKRSMKPGAVELTFQAGGGAVLAEEVRAFSASPCRA